MVSCYFYFVVAVIFCFFFFLFLYCVYIYTHPFVLYTMTVVCFLRAILPVFNTIIVKVTVSVHHTHEIIIIKRATKKKINGHCIYISELLLNWSNIYQGEKKQKKRFDAMMVHSEFVCIPIEIIRHQKGVQHFFCALQFLPCTFHVRRKERKK